MKNSEVGSCTPPASELAGCTTTTDSVRIHWPLDLLSLFRLPSDPVWPPGPSNIIVSGEGEEAEWELDAILDKRVIRKKNQYLVKYKGYKLLRDCEWRPETELQELAPELLAEFNDEINKPSAKP